MTDERTTDQQPATPKIPEPGPDAPPVFEETTHDAPPVVDAPERNTEF